MNRESLKNPVIATFLWALGINIALWFYINVIWLGSENRTFFGRIGHAYTTPFSLIPGILAPIFVGFITALLVLAYQKSRNALGTKPILKWLIYVSAPILYLPLALLGVTFILTIG